jgi:hypothetical protein
VIQVVETRALRGTGDDAEDVCRIVTQYWDLDGNLLAEKDEWADGQLVAFQDGVGYVPRSH